MSRVTQTFSLVTAASPPCFNVHRRASSPAQGEKKERKEEQELEDEGRARGAKERAGEREGVIGQRSKKKEANRR